MDIVDLSLVIEARRHERQAEDLRRDRVRVANIFAECSDLMDALQHGRVPPGAIVVARSAGAERPTLRLVDGTAAEVTHGQG